MTAVEHEGRTYWLGRRLEPHHDPASRTYPAAIAALRTDWDVLGELLADQGDATILRPAA